MLTYKNILYAVTKILSDNFSCDIIVENQEGTFENECFYVTLIPVTSEASTLKTDKKQLMLSIKYFGGSKLENYDMANRLECLFSRNINVKDRALKISSTEPNFLVDEVGDMLDFLIYITYFDIQDMNYIDDDKYTPPNNEGELMNSINVKI